MFAGSYAYAFTLDVAWAIVQKDKAGGFDRYVQFEDAQQGYFIRDLVKNEDFNIIIGDQDARRFSHESQCTGTDEIGALTNSTWIIHHVSPMSIACMWQTDLAMRYILDRSGVAEDGSEELPDLCVCVENIALPNHPFRREESNIL